MNQHDLHAALGDLAQRGADEQAERLHRGAGLSAPAIARRSARARRRRTAVTAVTGVAAVAGLVLAGSALADRPDPQPADTPTITHPTPSPSPTPSASADDPVTAAPPVQDTDDTDAAIATSGVVRPYPTAPTALWTADAGSLWTSTDVESEGSTPVVGDVAATPHSYPGSRAIAAGGALLFAVGVPPFDERLVGLDDAGGAVRWSWLQDAEDRVLSCAGTYDDLLVCQGVADGEPVVQLRDQVSGAVVRTVGPGGNGIAVADDAVVVHGSVDADVYVRVVDLATGAVRSTIDLPGYVDEDTPPGDHVVWPETAGSLVLLHGVQYQLALDVRTGTVLAEGMRPVGVRADGWVTATADDGTAHAVGPHGEDVTLPGIAATTMGVWAPAAGLEVPLLTRSDSGDGLPDAVEAVDGETGQALWSVAGASAVQAVAGRTAVLVGDSALIGVDVVTGAELWRTGRADVQAFDGERFVIAGADGVQGVRATDGDVAWTLPRSELDGVLAAGSLLVGIGPDGSLSALTS
jgi:hypothetical protein